MTALEAQLGEGVVVRSDDVDGNDVRGVVRTPTGEWTYAASFTDAGDVVSCEVEPA